MGFLGKLFGVGAVAGAAVAASKVADKYKENNPNGVQDVNGDGKVDYNDVVAEVTKAASAVYDSASAKVKETAGNVMEKAPEVYEKAKEKAKEAIDNAPETFEKVKTAATAKAKEVAADAKEVFDEFKENK